MTLEFPPGDELPSYLTGGQAWPWTAHFEAFVAPFDPGSGDRATPAGTYRFVVRGMHRSGGAAAPYKVISKEFEVEPWSGITVEDMRLEANRAITFKVGPRTTRTAVGGGPTVQAEIGPIDYPDSYDSPARFVERKLTAYRDPAAPGDASKLEWFCFTCSFRPWIDAGDATAAVVTIRNARTGRVVARVPAHPSGDRWVVSRRLRPDEVARVERGDVTDAYGNYNRAASVELSGRPATAPAGPEGGEGPGQAAAGECGHSIRGTAGDDVLRGTTLGDRISGGGGDDEVRAGAGDDCVRAGGGHDVIRCGPGDDDYAAITRRDTVRGCERVHLSSR